MSGTNSDLIAEARKEAATHQRLADRSGSVNERHANADRADLYRALANALEVADADTRTLAVYQRASAIRGRRAAQ